MVLNHPPGQTLTEQVRARMSSSWLTEPARSAVDAYDPAGEAVWWVSPPAVNEPLMGRAVLGGRPRRQAELEDKLAVDAILEAVGATRAGQRCGPSARTTTCGPPAGPSAPRSDRRPWSGPATRATASTAAATTCA